MTKEKELLMNQTFRQFMDAGLGLGSADVLNDIVNDKVMGFGTTIDEKIFNLDELKALIARQKEQSKDIDLKWEIKPLSHYTSTDENTAFFADELLFHATMGGETIEMYLRFSVVLSYVNNEWKVIHWHGSKPENVQSEEDTFGIETWKQKAEALERLVDERTADLKEKNRELEIEASLEKVRGIAMSMSELNDLLSVCEVLFSQLYKIGFKEIRCALIHIFKDERGYFDDYDYSDFTGGKISTMPYKGNKVVEDFLKAIRKSDDSFAEVVVKGEELAEFISFRKKTGQIDDPRLLNAAEISYYFYSVGSGNIGISNFGKIEKAQVEILKRYRNVFDLAYRRYLDIEKAIAQTREAEIELALERVRARTMAMQSSDELRESVLVINEQLQHLGFESRATNIIIIDKASGDCEYWVSGFTKDIYPVSYRVPKLDHPYYDALLTPWINGDQYIVYEYKGGGKKSFDKLFFTEIEFKNVPEEAKLAMTSLPSVTLSTAFFTNGALQVIGLEAISDEKAIILKRFAKVFDQTYTRFLDLQKAEAQAREAQIESALERVRSRSMAMHHTSELQDVIHIVHKELVNLNLSVDGGSFVVINDDVSSDLRCWGAGGTAITSEEVNVPHFNLPFCTNLIKGIKSGPRFFTEEFSQEEKSEYFTKLFDQKPWSDLDDEQKKEALSTPGGYTRSVAVSNHTSIFIINHVGRKFIEAENEILNRFAKVFEQTYTRFLDLQNAEAQTKEAQVELSLERIRAKVTAMQRSTDLLDIVVTMRREFVALGHEAHYFWHMRWLPDTYEKAMTSGDGSKIGMVMQLPRHIHGDIKLLADWEATDEPTVVMAMDGETAAGYVHKMITLGDFEQVDPNAPTLDDIRNIGGLTFIMSRTTHGEIGYSLPGCVPDPPAKGIATINRFAAVFDLAYRRFEDLQSSEKRIREAQIELAIERVRAQTLAMHKSEELANLSLELVKQVQTLGVNTWFCAFNIYDENSQDSIEWGSNGQGTFPKYRTPREGIFLRYYKAGQKNESLFINQIGEDECPAHYEYLCTLPGVGEQLLKMKAEGIPFPTSQIDHVAFFKYGYLIFITYEPVPESHVIFQRFAKVFEQTYTRFLDLQKAEAQAREAEIQLALERVRARSLAMHHTSELQDIVNEVARQLQQMGMNINGGVFIAINEEINDHIELWASAGSADYVQKVRVPYLDRPIFIGLRDAIKKGNDLFNKIFSKEEKDEMFHHLFQFDPWSKLPEERKEDLLSREGGLTRTAAIGQYTSVVITNHHGIAFTDAEIEVLKRFNIVFEQSYTRFMDLQKAEQLAKQAQIDLENLIAAKKKTEETLTELKATQSQLIQSEKMASLGELTAGIAHEIQNPLNFVNNFSEVSKELLDEMKDALENGDAAEAKELAADIIGNLEKITHHGKRADAIVKGMLQHSRSSSATKEPTDINKLADEYLRLSYHGLRAKDKTFNASYKNHFDDRVGIIDVVPQDIGRVLLNLLNNAFYSVTEKKKKVKEGYEPLVELTTARTGGNVLIRVRDNGMGIPQTVLDKIYQPFFTTKPTGAGTGLGLSMSYDIITKGHGGTLKASTIEREYAEFEILLPA